MSEFWDVNSSAIEEIGNLNKTIYPSFGEVFKNHQDNLSQKWEHYFKIYQGVYHQFIGNHPNVLEIGVENGGGLQITSKYFVNGNIYGVDINPKVCEMNLGSNIKTYCFDINDRSNIKKHFSDIQFDVILDDGSHINSDIIKTFKTLFPQLKSGGVYVVEDIHSSYWSNYEGGYLKKNTAIEFFKGFIDLLNAYYIAMGADTNFIKNLSTDDRYVFEWLDSIAFHDSVVVVKKLAELRAGPYKQVTAGTVHPIIDVKSYLQDSNTLLYRGVLYQDVKEIKSALAKGANIDHIHEASGTALSWAVQKKFLEIVQVLLDAGADAEIKSANKETPLTISIQNHDFNMTKLLVEAGADLENPNGLGSTPLFIASYFGYDDILQFLIEKGANKNATVQGISAFQAALQEDHPSSAIILAGSSENFCQQIQATEYEFKYADICEEVEQLHKSITINLEDKMTVKTLSTIVTKEIKVDLPATKRILPLPNDLVFIIDTRDNVETYYNLTSGLGHEPDMIKKMMDFASPGDTYIEVGANYGDFTLQMSKKIGDKGQVYAFEPGRNLFQCFTTSIFLNGMSNIILENLAVLDKKQEISFFEDVYGSLGSKIAPNGVKISAIALDDYFKGDKAVIDMIRLDAEGNECQVLRGAQNIIDSSPNIKLFIEWQKPLLTKYETAATMQECLSNLQHRGFIFLDILNFHENCNNQVYRLTVDDILASGDILEFLAIKETTLQNSIKIDSLNNHTEKCPIDLNQWLFSSMFRNNVKNVKFALEQGADIDYRHKGHITSLYWSAQEGYYDIAKVLVDAGADLEIKAMNNMTPLIMSVQNHDFNMTKLLVEAGADLENPNGLGSTPLFIASYFGYDDVLQLLLENGANKNIKVQGINAFQAALQQDHLDAAIILAGSKENFCQQIQATEYELKYAELCGEASVI